MSRYYTGDPVADAERYFADREKELERLPRCSECDHPITTDKAYYINGEWICEECMEQYHIYLPEM